jgi:hypothetical protein
VVALHHRLGARELVRVGLGVACSCSASRAATSGSPAADRDGEPPRLLRVVPERAEAERLSRLCRYDPLDVAQALFAQAAARDLAAALGQQRELRPVVDGLLPRALTVGVDGVVSSTWWVGSLVVNGSHVSSFMVHHSQRHENAEHVQRHARDDAADDDEAGTAQPARRIVGLRVLEEAHRLPASERLELDFARRLALGARTNDGDATRPCAPSRAHLEAIPSVEPQRSHPQLRSSIRRHRRPPARRTGADVSTRRRRA